MANLIILVKNDESEAGDHGTDKCGPWCGRCSPLDARASGAAVDIAASRGLSQRRSMAHISEYSIVTYERKPGHWRAAIIPKARFGIAVRGDKVLSFVTPDDYATESEAKFAAEQAIRKL